MKRIAIVFSLVLSAFFFSVVPPMTHDVQAQTGPPQVPQLVSALGVTRVQGQEVFVHVIAVVQPGENGRAVAEAALAEQGARPVTAAPFATTGLRWPQFSDGSATNDNVTQNYNPANQPTGLALSQLTETHSDWSSVSGSIFRLTKGESNTARCPSLVRECRGPQVWDGKNDVGWLALGRSTLGVTWYGNGGPAGAEADMAMNTRFKWSTSCTQENGKFDLQTVFLHENGHVAGLDHSQYQSAVMYASYQAARCNLSLDDMDGLRSLYH